MPHRIKVIMISLAIIVVIFLSIGFDCGYISYKSAKSKTCECLGVESFDQGDHINFDDIKIRCLGLCFNCVCEKYNSTSKSLDEIPCE